MKNGLLFIFVGFYLQYDIFMDWQEAKWGTLIISIGLIIFLSVPVKHVRGRELWISIARDLCTLIIYTGIYKLAEYFLEAEVAESFLPISLILIGAGLIFHSVIISRRKKEIKA